MSDLKSYITELISSGPDGGLIHGGIGETTRPGDFLGPNPHTPKPTVYSSVPMPGQQRSILMEMLQELFKRPDLNRRRNAAWIDLAGDRNTTVQGLGQARNADGSLIRR